MSELVWREFYVSILWHFPEVLDMEFNPKFRGMDWPGGAGTLRKVRASTRVSRMRSGVPAGHAF